MPPAATWDPVQYHRFSDLRLRPAIELLTRVSLEDPALVHDIGTGGGEIARLMKQRWPHATVIGSDSSSEMLDEARRSASAVDWRQIDLSDWHPQPEHDVIYANAVLHWLPRHDELFDRLVGGLRDGGELAVQMPMSWWQPSHQAIRAALEALDSSAGATLGRQMAEPNVAQPDWYWQVIKPLVSELDIWETTYQQVLSGTDPVFEWISGSILRPVFSALPPDQLERFDADCRERLRQAYPQQIDGTTLFPFRRLFLVARR